MADGPVGSEAEAPPDIVFETVSRHYGPVRAVDRVDLTIPKGAFVSLLGPSGCGKTTSLRMMAGFEQPSEGRVRIEGEDVTGRPAYLRPVNMVFQHYALFPHLGVFDNVAYGLRQRRPRIAEAEVKRRVGEALEQVRLGHLSARRTHEMSGGQQQRVALARALVNRPKVLLLDEPLAALDRKLRREMQIELQNLQREVGITFVLVTHDQEEALSMSDLVAVMREGRIAQAGKPAFLYDEPQSRYVADFVGKSNFLPATLESVAPPVLRLADGQAMTARQPEGAAPARPGPVTLAVRPERISLVAQDTPGASGLSVTVRNRIFLGENTEYLVENAALGSLLVTVPKQVETGGGFRPGEGALASWPAGAALILADD